MQKEIKQRSGQQNRSLYKFFRVFAEQLNTLGLDAKLILKDNYQIWWTPEMVKRDLWKPLQEAMFSKDSTAELTTKELQEVFEQLSKIIGEKHKVEISFPNQEDLERAKFYEKK